MSTNQLQTTTNQEYFHEYPKHYQTVPQQNSLIIEGFFPKENIKKEMAIRKINTTLTVLLGIFLVLTSVSYYFATANEIVLNDLSRQTIVLNDENAELQNKLDKLRSLNNVDMSMKKSNMLQKAQQVLEVPSITSNMVADKKLDGKKPFTWAIGY